MSKHQQASQQAGDSLSRSLEKTTSQGELHERDLERVTGGRVMHGDLQVQKYLDKPSVILF